MPYPRKSGEGILSPAPIAHPFQTPPAGGRGWNGCIRRMPYGHVTFHPHLPQHETASSFVFKLRVRNKRGFAPLSLASIMMLSDDALSKVARNLGSAACPPGRGCHGRRGIVPPPG